MTTPTKPHVDPVSVTTFVRFRHRQDLLLDTPWGPVKLTKTKTGWHLFTMSKGTAIGQNFDKLEKAMLAAMRIKNITSTKLINQTRYPSLCELR